MAAVPLARVRALIDVPPDPSGSFVIYWMTTARRMRFNYGLQRAVELSTSLRRPLVVLEALRCDYPWASDRFHRFVLDGMADNAAAARETRALYYPYVEPSPGDGRGLLRALGKGAAAVVTDAYPSFFIPRMLEAAARQISTRLESVDSNGLIPMADHGRAFPTARGYRAFVQRSFRQHLSHWPEEHPLDALSNAPRLRRLPDDITSRWPAVPTRTLGRPASLLAGLPIDHGVTPVSHGGNAQALLTLRQFVRHRLARYGDEHNHPDLDVTSRLSPYLHFGHISAQEVFAAVMTAERWTTRKLAQGARGARAGWWGVSTSAEAFLDQLVIWRELAFNGAHYTPRFGSYDTLPAWARQTLETHRADPRAHAYSLDALEAAMTHDAVWNAAMTQLKSEGWFHGYMRMLWGKKILEWCRDPADALAHMEHLMNRYALDGRDPVSSASFAWVLGLYDRPWPERPIFGTVRCMTSASARRKLKLTRYLATYTSH